MNSEESKFIKTLLIEKGFNFSMISGKFEILGSEEEFKINSSYWPDIDIFFFDDMEAALPKLELIGFIRIGHTSFKYNWGGKQLDLDFYFNEISFNGVYLFRPERNELDEFIISEESYILYQTIEPLLKFGEYKCRHLTRLSKYSSDQKQNNKYIQRKLFILLFPFSSFLKGNHREGFQISPLKHRLLKIRFIIRPKNILKYIKHRFFSKPNYD